MESQRTIMSEDGTMMARSFQKVLKAAQNNEGFRFSDSVCHLLNRSNICKENILSRSFNQQRYNAQQ